MLYNLDGDRTDDTRAWLNDLTLYVRQQVDLLVTKNGASRVDLLLLEQDLLSEMAVLCMEQRLRR